MSESRPGAPAGNRPAAPSGGNPSTGPAGETPSFGRAGGASSTDRAGETPSTGPAGGASSTGSGPIRRARFLAWLVTGPVGRLTGFFLDFARELWRLIHHP